MAERVEIDIIAKDKASKEIKKATMNLREMGEKVSSLGMRLSAAFTAPVIGLGMLMAKAGGEASKQIAELEKTAADAQNKFITAQRKAYSSGKPVDPETILELNQLAQEANAAQAALSGVDPAIRAQAQAWNEFQQMLQPARQELNKAVADLMVGLLPVMRELTPYLIEGAKWVAGMAKAFSELDTGTKTMIITAIGLVATVGPILVIAGQVINAIGTIQMLLPGLATSFTATATAATTALAPLIPLLAAIAGLIALINSPFGQKGITAGKQLLAMGAGFGAFAFSGGNMEAGKTAIYNTSKDLGLINTPTPTAGGQVVNNYNYNGVMVTPQNSAALKPYLDQYNRQNGGK